MNGIGSRPYCLWERMCGPDLRQGTLATRSWCRVTVTLVGYRARLDAGSRILYNLLSFLPPPPFTRAFLSVQQSRTLFSSTFFFNPFFSSHRLLEFPSS